jgi:hypothetical protein
VAYALPVSSVAIVPAAFLFLALGPQIMAAAFERGTVTGQDTRAMGYVLMAFALGLIPFSAQYLLVRVFYALHDTKTPLAIAVWTTCAHAWLSIVAFIMLPARWAVAGMAAGLCDRSGGYRLEAALPDRRLRTADGGTPAQPPRDGQHRRSGHSVRHRPGGRGRRRYLGIAGRAHTRICRLPRRFRCARANPADRGDLCSRHSRPDEDRMVI